jgi:hypothetical protein
MGILNLRILTRISRMRSMPGAHDKKLYATLVRLALSEFSSFMTNELVFRFRERCFALRGRQQLLLYSTSKSIRE